MIQASRFAPLMFNNVRFHYKNTVSSIPSVRQKKIYRLMKEWNYPNMEITIFIENKRNYKWTNHSKKKQKANI